MSHYKNSSHLLADLIADFIEAIGRKNVLTKLSQQQAYVHGIIKDDAAPQVLAVIVPQSLVALWRVINICAEADPLLLLKPPILGLPEDQHLLATMIGQW